jgi:hypothetical protein
MAAAVAAESAQRRRARQAPQGRVSEFEHATPGRSSALRDRGWTGDTGAIAGATVGQGPPYASVEHRPWPSLCVPRLLAARSFIAETIGWALAHHEPKARPDLRCPRPTALGSCACAGRHAMAAPVAADGTATEGETRPSRLRVRGWTRDTGAIAGATVDRGPPYAYRRLQSQPSRSPVDADGERAPFRCHARPPRKSTAHPINCSTMDTASAPTEGISHAGASQS